MKGSRLINLTRRMRELKIDVIEKEEKIFLLSEEIDRELDRLLDECPSVRIGEAVIILADDEDSYNSMLEETEE